MTIPAKGVPAKEIPVRKRQAEVTPVVNVEEVVETVEVTEAAAPKKTSKKKLFSKE